MDGSSSMRILIALGIVGLFGIITFALAAATIGTLNKQYDNLNEKIVALQKKIDFLSSTTTTAAVITITPTPSTASTNATIATGTPITITPTPSTAPTNATTATVTAATAATSM